jgi:hypothetical protein
VLEQYYELQPERHLSVLHNMAAPTVRIKYAVKKRFRWSKMQHELFVDLMAQGVKSELYCRACSVLIGAANRLHTDGAADRRSDRRTSAQSQEALAHVAGECGHGEVVECDADAIFRARDDM